MERRILLRTLLECEDENVEMKKSADISNKPRAPRSGDATKRESRKNVKMAFLLLLAGAVAIPAGQPILGYVLMAVGFIMHLTSPAESGNTAKRAFGYLFLAAVAVALPMAYEHYYYHSH